MKAVRYCHELPTDVVEILEILRTKPDKALSNLIQLINAVSLPSCKIFGINAWEVLVH